MRTVVTCQVVFDNGYPSSSATLVDLSQIPAEVSNRLEFVIPGYGDPMPVIIINKEIAND